MADDGLLTVVFAASEGNVRGEFSSVSRMIVIDMFPDLPHEKAVEYCYCISHAVSQDAVERLVDVVGGRFGDLKHVTFAVLRSGVYHQQGMFGKIRDELFSLEVPFRPTSQDETEEHVVWCIAKEVLKENSSMELLTFRTMLNGQSEKMEHANIFIVDSEMANPPW